MPRPAARAQAPAGANETEANTLVDQAATAYDQNQLDEALRLLSRAYELSPRPSILYNRAQVLRTKDDCAGALEDYRRFLETAPPDDANRERATRRRDEMQACADERKPPAPAPRLEGKEATLPAQPAGVIVRTSETAAQPEDNSHNHRRAMRAGAWTGMGVAILAAGAAAILEAEAHSIQTRLNNDLSRPDFLWTDQQQRQANEGEHYAIGAWLCVGLSAVAAGGSATLFILSRSPDSGGAPSVSAQPHARFIGFSGTF